VLAAQGFMVKYGNKGPKYTSLSPQYSLLPPLPCSSHTTTKNLVPIWLSHSLLKK
jgi:hypothetical protein